MKIFMVFEVGFHEANFEKAFSSRENAQQFIDHQVTEHFGSREVFKIREAELDQDCVCKST